jgi:hypothetical protein
MLQVNGPARPRLLYVEAGESAMMHEPLRYDYLPLIDRPTIRWPDGARVAFWVCPNVEFYELNASDGQGRPIWPRPYSDVSNYSLRLRQPFRRVARHGGDGAV